MPKAPLIKSDNFQQVPVSWDTASSLLVFKSSQCYFAFPSPPAPFSHLTEIQQNNNKTWLRNTFVYVFIYHYSNTWDKIVSLLMNLERKSKKKTIFWKLKFLTNPIFLPAWCFFCLIIEGLYGFFFLFLFFFHSCKEKGFSHYSSLLQGNCRLWLHSFRRQR